MVYTEVFTNLVAGILIIGFGIIVGNILYILAKKLLQSFEVERILQDLGVRFPFESFIASIVKYGAYITGLIWGLTFLGLETIILYAVLFIILGLLISFILLGFKDFIPNVIAGIVIHWRRKVRKGQIIHVDGVEGRILGTDLLELRIKTTDDDVVVIPNVLLLRKKIVVKKVRK